MAARIGRQPTTVHVWLTSMRLLLFVLLLLEQESSEGVGHWALTAHSTLVRLSNNRNTSGVHNPMYLLNYSRTWHHIWFSLWIVCFLPVSASAHPPMPTRRLSRFCEPGHGMQRYIVQIPSFPGRRLLLCSSNFKLLLFRNLDLTPRLLYCGGCCCCCCQPTDDIVYLFSP